MSGENTLTSLNTQFKYIQDKAQSLLPENAVMMKLVPEITEATKEGRKYLVRRGGGVFDRVIDIGADGLSTGLSYLVSAKDVSDEQPVYFGMVGVDL